MARLLASYQEATGGVAHAEYRFAGDGRHACKMTCCHPLEHVSDHEVMNIGYGARCQFVTVVGGIAFADPGRINGEDNLATLSQVIGHGVFAQGAGNIEIKIAPADPPSRYTTPHNVMRRDFCGHKQVSRHRVTSAGGVSSYINLNGDLANPSRHWTPGSRPWSL
jgi:hypothetical protein